MNGFSSLRDLAPNVVWSKERQATFWDRSTSGYGIGVAVEIRDHHHTSF